MGKRPVARPAEEAWYWDPGIWSFVLMAVSEVFLAIICFWGMPDKMLWQRIFGFVGFSFVFIVVCALYVHPIDDFLCWLKKRKAAKEAN